MLHLTFIAYRKGSRLKIQSPLFLGLLLASRKSTLLLAKNFFFSTFLLIDCILSNC